MQILGQSGDWARDLANLLSDHIFWLPDKEGTQGQNCFLRKPQNRANNAVFSIGILPSKFPAFLHCTLPGFRFRLEVRVPVSSVGHVQ